MTTSNIFKLFHLVITPTQLTFITAAFLALTANGVFFAHLTDIYPFSAGNIGFVLSVGVLLFCGMVLFITLISILLPIRIVSTIFLLSAAVIGFYADRFGIIIDAGMLQNIVETDTAEAKDLFSLGLVLYLIVLALFPLLLLLCLISIKQKSWLRELRYRIQAIVAALAIAAACIFIFSDSYASFFREHKSLRYYSNPIYAIYSVARVVSDSLATATGSRQLLTVANDAVIPETNTGHELIIMVVGETARRDKFSLNGYARDTNPKLSKEKNLISFSNISACGTSTATSVPCMFSSLDQDHFSNSKADARENVLDILVRVGVSVLWLDNNSSSKGVADRVAYKSFKNSDVNPVCDSECRDVGMLQGLQDYIDAQSGDILIVLHQMGNHGPAYFKRYPKEFERFTPACLSIELSDCSLEEINNAYDNAILYTDYFLSQTIALLKANTPKFETAMLYVSDHGESLGENGLYLHGMPYMMAPKEQLDVPVIAWVGDSSDVDLPSALEHKDVKNSQDAVFHSLLALFEVETDFKLSSDDLFELKVD